MQHIFQKLLPLCKKKKDHLHLKVVYRIMRPMRFSRFPVFAFAAFAFAGFASAQTAASGAAAADDNKLAVEAIPAAEQEAMDAECAFIMALIDANMPDLPREAR